MRIFEKIEITNEVQKMVLSGYKYEMKLAISVLVVCMLAMILTLYLSPIILTIGIVLQTLVFTKYLYDRRVKLKKDINKFSY
jgi:Flp pilus assembly protein TadB